MAVTGVTDRRKNTGRAAREAPPECAKPELSAVQTATAPAAFVAGFGREIFVDCPQVRPEAGGTE
jgi:hypothetical protein